MRRADRLFDVIQVLRTARKPVTAATLAEELEVTHSDDRERDVDDIMRRFSARLEALVTEYPGQYFWQHRRWKHQPPDTPPHLREP